MVLTAFSYPIDLGYDQVSLQEAIPTPMKRHEADIFKAQNSYQEASNNPQADSTVESDKPLHHHKDNSALSKHISPLQRQITLQSRKHINIWKCLFTHCAIIFVDTVGRKWRFLQPVQFLRQSNSIGASSSCTHDIQARLSPLKTPVFEFQSFFINSYPHPNAEIP